MCIESTVRIGTHVVFTSDIFAVLLNWSRNCQPSKFDVQKKCLKKVHFFKGPSINDVTLEGEGGGCGKWHFGVIFKAYLG